MTLISRLSSSAGVFLAPSGFSAQSQFSHYDWCDSQETNEPVVKMDNFAGLWTRRKLRLHEQADTPQQPSSSQPSCSQQSRTFNEPPAKQSRNKIIRGDSTTPTVSETISEERKQLCVLNRDPLALSPTQSLAESSFLTPPYSACAAATPAASKTISQHGNQLCMVNQDLPALSHQFLSQSHAAAASSGLHRPWMTEISPRYLPSTSHQTRADHAEYSVSNIRVHEQAARMLGAGRVNNFENSNSWQHLQDQPRVFAEQQNQPPPILKPVALYPWDYNTLSSFHQPLVYRGPLPPLPTQFLTQPSPSHQSTTSLLTSAPPRYSAPLQQQSILNQQEQSQLQEAQCDVDKPIGCTYPDCPRRFTNNSHLNRHIRSFHLKEKPHVCETCGKGFSQISDLTVHTALHSGEKPHVCETCGKGFSQEGYLRKHKPVHTDARPHKCKKCNSSFRQTSSLSRHNRQVHQAPAVNDPGAEVSSESK